MGECKIMRYSDKTQIWETLKTPYIRISGKGLGYYQNGLLYYAGGIDTGNIGVHKYTYTFSEKENKCQQITDFPYQFSNGVMYQFNNKMYVGLGEGVYDTRVSLFSLE
jgi:N-acetylneuraminic acid mutarotase